MFRAQSGYLAAVALIVLQLPALGENSNVVAGNQSLNEVTIELAQKQLELIRLNTNLKITQLPRNAWGQRSWAAQNLANVSLTATGAFINGCSRFSYLHKRRLANAPKEIFVEAGWCRVTANSITTISGVLACALMASSDVLNHERKVDLGTMSRYADKLQNEIDGLLARREALVKSSALAGAELELVQTEGAVLADLRNLQMNEFANFYSTAKGDKATAYFGYLWAAMSNANAGAGGITANCAANSHHGSKRFRTRYAGTGGICDIVSGGMNFATPAVTRLVGHIAKKSSGAAIRRKLDCEEPAQLDALHRDESRLRLLANSTVGEVFREGAAKRDQLYAKEMAVLDEHEKMRIGAKAAAKRKLVDQLVFFSGIGPPKFINGIGGTVAAFKYTNQKSQQFRAVGGCALAYGAGYCVSAAELLRNQVSVETRGHKAKVTGTSARQVLTRELAELDALRSSGSPTAAKPMFTSPLAMRQTASELTASETAAGEPPATELAASESTSSEPTSSESTSSESTAMEPVATRPMATADITQ